MLEKVSDRDRRIMRWFFGASAVVTAALSIAIGISSVLAGDNLEGAAIVIVGIAFGLSGIAWDAELRRSQGSSNRQAAR